MRLPKFQLVRTIPEPKKNQHLRPKCVTMYMHRACVQHHHLIRSSSCNSTAIWSCFKYNLRSGVMSLAENILWASWSFDCRVKIKNIIPVTCRNSSINRQIQCCFIYIFLFIFISNNFLFFKLVITSEHWDSPCPLQSRRPETAAENTHWMNEFLNIRAMYWYTDKEDQNKLFIYRIQPVNWITAVSAK